MSIVADVIAVDGGAEGARDVGLVGVAARRERANGRVVLCDAHEDSIVPFPVRSPPHGPEERRYIFKRLRTRALSRSNSSRNEK